MTIEYDPLALAMLRRHLRRHTKIMAEQGWSMAAHSPMTGHTFGFMHTIGLTPAGLPELVMTGVLQFRLMAPLLNAVATRSLVDDPAAGTVWDLADGTSEAPMLVKFGPVYSGWAASKLGLVHLLFPSHAITALQVMWADVQGNFPGSDDWNGPAACQPLLATRPAA